MSIQEIIVFTIVLIAAVFTVRKFIRQFTHIDGSESCDQCELNKAIPEKRS